MEEDMMYKVYAVEDPGTGRIRYVGVSSDPAERIRTAWAHRHGREQSLSLWLRSLSACPSWHVVENVPPDDRWAAERRWIRVYREMGHDLVNWLGGQGGTLPGTGRGRKQTADEIEKRVRRLRGQKRSPEARAAISAGKKGKPTHRKTQDEKDRISAALKGRPSPTAGMKFSEETREKMRRSQAARRSRERQRS